MSHGGTLAPPLGEMGRQWSVLTRRNVAALGKDPGGGGEKLGGQ